MKQQNLLNPASELIEAVDVDIQTMALTSPSHMQYSACLGWHIHRHSSALLSQWLHCRVLYCTMQHASPLSKKNPGNCNLLKSNETWRATGSTANETIRI